jgi:RNA polymerase sigma-70 factor (ECF subfamily)
VTATLAPLVPEIADVDWALMEEHAALESPTPETPATDLVPADEATAPRPVRSSSSRRCRSWISCTPRACG